MYLTRRLRNVCVRAQKSLSLRVRMCSLLTEFVCADDCVPTAPNWQVGYVVSVNWEGVCVCALTPKKAVCALCLTMSLCVQRAHPTVRLCAVRLVGCTSRVGGRGEHC